jgi:plastocyanin
MISALLLGGFMFGAGLSLFQDDGGSGAGGEATVAPVEQPFRVTATDNKFDKRVITAGPNAEITITLTNRGAAKHNIHFTDKKGGATLADGAQGAIIDGGTETTVTFTTPAAGEYYFLCDLHPDEMNGTFTVVDGGPTGSGEAAAAAPAG